MQDALFSSRDSNSAAKCQVLLVEGEEETRKGLADMLRQRRGMHVIEAATIADALEAIGDSRVSLDLTVLDYLLPAGESRRAWCRRYDQKLWNGDLVADVNQAAYPSS